MVSTGSTNEPTGSTNESTGSANEPTGSTNELRVEETSIPGLLVVHLPVHGDARGWFDIIVADSFA